MLGKVKNTYSNTGSHISPLERDCVFERVDRVEHNVERLSIYIGGVVVIVLIDAVAHVLGVMF